MAWRITKYNPALRDSSGRYRRDEWPGVSDVGKRYRGVVFTSADYVDVEDLYVQAVRAALSRSSSDGLTVFDLEDSAAAGAVPEEFRSETALMRQGITEGMTFPLADVDRAVRLALREVIWCKLESSDGAYVHFGYDSVSLTHGCLTGTQPERDRTMDSERSFRLTRVGIAILLLTAVPIAYVVGFTHGREEVFNAHLLRQDDQIQAILGGQHVRYARLHIAHETQGDAYLVGAVRTEADREALRAELVQEFGADLADFMVMCVEVQQEEP